jgi:hypothetical protein
MVLKDSPTRIYTKQLQVSQTGSCWEVEALERFTEEYCLLPICKSRPRKYPMIPGKEVRNSLLRLLAWEG